MSATPPQEPSAAELFERFFGPSISQPSTSVLLEHAAPRRGERVLDLACATGIVARRVARLVGSSGEVVGLDISPEMLDVARERAAAEGVSIAWHEGDATDLRLPDDTFDLLLCQQGLQFFDDPLAALRESRRVLAPDGRIVLSVWQPLDRHPVYAALLKAEADLLDAELEDAAKPFMFGEGAKIEALLHEAGFDDVEVLEHSLEVAFPDPDTFVALTAMAGAAVVPEFAQDDPAERQEMIDEVTRRIQDVLRAHRDGDRLRFPMPNYVAVARA